MRYGLGCHKAPEDTRDYLLMGFMKDTPLPLEYDLRFMMTPINNQGKRGSCVGHAIDGIKEYQEQIDYGKFVDLSAEDVYVLARDKGGYKAGANLRDGMGVVKNHGICEERFRPYSDKGDTAPIMILDGETYIESAGRHKIKSYARVRNYKEVKRAIYSFGPILAGVLVYKTMLKVKSDGVVADPKMWLPSNWRPLGGHAIPLVGWKLIDGKTYYIFKNSWGREWGDCGYGYLSEDYIKNHMLDCFSCIDIEGSGRLGRIYTIGDMAPLEKKWNNDAFPEHPHTDWVGKDKWKLTASFEYHRRNGEVIRAESGFITDGGSKPPIVWLFCGSPTDEAFPAYVIHDWLCVRAAWGRAKTDRIFLEAMRDCGVPYLKRMVMYWAVRIWSYF